MSTITGKKLAFRPTVSHLMEASRCIDHMFNGPPAQVKTTQTARVSGTHPASLGLKVYNFFVPDPKETACFWTEYAP